MNIEFNCANCRASLKTVAAFAGKTIQCPKCLKKTAVPALATAPQPAQPAPAPGKPVPPPVPSADTKPAAKPPADDGIYVAFACEKCSASLKVLKSFAGKTIQCPKCAKKTLVPGGSPKPAAPVQSAASPPPPAISAPQANAEPVPPKAPETTPPPPAPEPALRIEPSAPPVPAPAFRPDADFAARLREQEQKMESLVRQMREQEQRLEVERMKVQKAEQEKMALATQKALDRQKLEADLSVHYQAEMDAARKTIVRLEEKVQEAIQQRLATSSAGGRTAVQIEKEMLENPDDALIESESAVPDAVMAEIRDSRFARYVRTSILLHALLLGGTSIGLIKAWIMPPPPEAEPGGTNAVPAVVSAPLSASPAAAPASGTAVESGSAPATSVVPSEAPAPPARTETEKKAEALPAPGEKAPTDTQVNLGL